MQDELEETEAEYAKAKAVPVGLADNCRTATLVLRTEGLRFNADIVKCEDLLFETADPLIDATIQFFRDKYDELRKPGKIDRRGRTTERNIFTWTKKTTQETNALAINDALASCRAAILELERMILYPELDLAKIEGMKSGVPEIGIYTEITREAPRLKALPSWDKMHNFIDDRIEALKIKAGIAQA